MVPNRDEVRALVEQNRNKIAAAIAELTALRDSVPVAEQVAMNRTIQRLGEALAGDVLYLQQHDSATSDSAPAK
jgi:hypothetical protein